MANGFWLSDSAWVAIEPLLPKNQPGARRVDNRRVISGIVHVLKSGCRWGKCPSVYGPPTTIYNRFNRWSWRGLWGRIFAELVAEDLSIDSTAVRVHPIQPPPPPGINAVPGGGSPFSRSRGKS